MKPIPGVVAVFVAILITGCSSNPLMASSSSSDAENTLSSAATYPATISATAPAVVQFGKSAVTVEKLAKSQGCEPAFGGASLISSSGPTTEQYQVRCVNGSELVAVCEYRQCAIKAANLSAAPVLVPSVVAPKTKPSLDNMQGANSEPISAPASRSSDAAKFSYVAGIGYARGGDILITATYTDGTHTSIKAGNGLHFEVGAQYRVSDHFAVLADIGYQSSTGSAPNGELTFKRFPIEVLGYFYLNNAIRFGAGARLDERVKLSGTGVAADVQADFDRAVGVIVEAEYLITPNFGFKLQGVREDYKQTGFTAKINGNQIGLYATLYF